MRTPAVALLLLPLSGLLLTACPPEIGEGKSAGECSDGLDNDGDGSIDCFDAGCMGYAHCTGETGEPDDTDTDTEIPTDPDITDDPVVVDPDVIINEFLASNSTSWEDPDYPGTFPDWIELINLTDHPVNLAGYGLTDDLTECDQHILAEGVTIEAGGYLILIADADEEEGIHHLNFALNREGEQLGLCNADMEPLTKLEYGEQVTDYSVARMPDGSDTWEFDATPTPGEANAL